MYNRPSRIALWAGPPFLSRSSALKPTCAIIILRVFRRRPTRNKRLQVEGDNDNVYDGMVRMFKLGVEAIVDKAHPWYA